MNQTILHLYHKFPSPLRSVAASARGAWLRMWRYGHETDRLVAEALEREQWSPDRWANWREERLAYVLDRAAKRVPYYREQWLKRRRAGDRASWEVLGNWPLLEKAVLRQNAISFVADDCDPRRMFHERTSGTSGMPLELWWSRKTVRAWYALSEARCRRWNGVSRQDRWAILGGQLVTPAAQQRPPFWVWNSALNQLYMSTYHLSSNLIPYYLDALRKYRVRYLWGYSSSLTLLAHEAQRLGWKGEIAVAVTNAEPLLDHQRSAISGAFGCPVRETYGMAEIVSAASECAMGRMHVWPEVGCMEFPDGVDAGESGAEIVCTGLLNADMPLIRYRVGDRGDPSGPSQSCECGRSLPVLGPVQGRQNDLLMTRDGRQIFWINPVFYGLPVREAQVIQRDLEKISVRYSPASGFDAASSRAIAARLRERLGDVEVSLEEVPHIPRGPNGKFRPVIREIPASHVSAPV